MFKIRRKPKHKSIVQAEDPSNTIAHWVLKAAVLHSGFQKLLVQYVEAVPTRKPALSPLIEAALNPSLPLLIAHATQHGIVTEEQATELIQGRVRSFELLKEDA